jgi:SAM-dependent methyltransferase
MQGHEDSMRLSAVSTIGGRMLTATFLVCVGILAVAYCNAQNLDVVFVPTPRETVDRMLQVTDVGSSDYVIDLGSGDGRIAIAAGRLGARALGVDLDPARVRDAQASAQRAGVSDRVTFQQQNLFETDLSQATVLTMYLLPSINLKLRPKILSLRPGTRVVSHDFTMGDWKPDLSETNNWRIFFWVVPARVAGKWQVRAGNRAFDLTINQTHQEFQGTAAADGRTAPLRNTKLRAANIEFTVDLDGQAATLRGVVSGDRMQGRSSGGTEWIATRS